MSVLNFIRAIFSPLEWDDFITTVEKIALIKFRTLTIEQIAEFIQHASRPITKIKGKWAGWDSDEWESKVSQWNEKRDKIPKRWSNALKMYIPAYLLDTKGDILPEAFEIAITEKLEELFELAAKHDIFLSYEMTALENRT